MIRVLLFGACGRMGRIAAAEVAGKSDLRLVAGVERTGHPDLGTEIAGAPLVADQGEFPESDVWLDFSLAAPALIHARRAADLARPLVVAATGFEPCEEDEFTRLARRCPILIAPNLSAGVGALESLAVQAMRLLPEGFEAVISELHHRAKKDAPSGTAKRIAERMGEFGRPPEIVSLRAGGAVGEHQIRFVGAEEELLLIHRAWSRRAFASGIARAIRFIAHQPAGFYSLQDIHERE